MNGQARPRRQPGLLFCSAEFFWNSAACMLGAFAEPQTGNTGPRSGCARRDVVTQREDEYEKGKNLRMAQVERAFSSFFRPSCSAPLRLCASPGTVLRSRRPQARLDTFCTRTGRPRRCPSRGGPAGKGLGRAARRYVSEESDSGVVPMKHSDQGIRPSVENADGRPLVKENTSSPHTRPTPSGVSRVPQRPGGVGRTQQRFAAIHPRQEP